MNRGQLLELHAKLTDDARKLIVVKNADYAGEDGDPFRNFRRWGLLGILVRLSDKVARLETFVTRGNLQVKSEQVRDTVIDIINYAILFEGYNADANAEGSGSGDRAWEKFARTVDEAIVSRFINTRQGMPGGDAGGARRGMSSPPMFPAFDENVHVKGRTGAGSGRRRAMDKQHRRATRKGKP